MEPDQVQTGVTVDQAAAGSPGENAQAAAEPTGVTEAAPQAAAEGKVGPGPVAYERFTEVNERMKTAERERDELRQQMLVAQANPSQRAEAAPKPMSIVDQAIAYAGVDPDGYWGAAEIKRVLETTVGLAQQQSSMLALDTQWSLQHPDAAEVVGTVDRQGRFVPSEPLARVIQKDPLLAALVPHIAGNPVVKQIAYRLATTDPDYTSKRPETRGPAAAGLEAERIEAKRRADAATRPGSASLAAGGKLDRVAEINSWTDEQVREYAERLTGLG